MKLRSFIQLDWRVFDSAPLRVSWQARAGSAPARSHCRRLGAATQSLAFLKMAAWGRHAVTGVPASVVSLIVAVSLVAREPGLGAQLFRRRVDRGANANERATRDSSFSAGPSGRAGILESGRRLGAAWNSIPHRARQ